MCVAEASVCVSWLLDVLECARQTLMLTYMTLYVFD